MRAVARRLRAGACEGALEVAKTHLDEIATGQCKKIWFHTAQRTHEVDYIHTMNDLEGTQLTAAQRVALDAELVDMEGPQRKAAVDAIATARAFGDLSENFEYHAAKNEQGLLEARITKLRRKLQHAVIVEHTSTDTVGVGSIVEVEDEQGEKMEIEISSVGGVSPDSPLGSALMGASVGTGVDVPAPRGSWRATVVSIRAA